MLNTDIETGIEIINKAIIKEKENKLWQQWLTLYPHMDKETFIPFSEFKKQLEQVKISKKESKNILKEAEEIMKSIKERG